MLKYSTQENLIYEENFERNKLEKFTKVIELLQK